MHTTLRRRRGLASLGAFEQTEGPTASNGSELSKGGTINYNKLHSDKRCHHPYTKWRAGGAVANGKSLVAFGKREGVVTNGFVCPTGGVQLRKICSHSNCS